MILRPKALVLILSLGLVAACTFVQGQQKQSVSLSMSLRRLQSNRSVERIESFYQLLALLSESQVAGNGTDTRKELPALRQLRAKRGNADVVLTLATLLTKENAFVETNQLVSQRFAEYYGDLIWAVSSLNDEALDAHRQSTGGS